MKPFPTIIQSYWKRRMAFVFSIAGMMCVLILSRLLLFPFLQNRCGIQFTDPVLRHFAPIDAGIFTLIVTYGSIAMGIVFLARTPERLLYFIQSCIFVYLFRMVTIVLLPLQAPMDKIPLNDIIAYGNTPVINDLFFSGHTAVIVLLFFCIKGQRQKLFICISLVCVILALLVQHQHYTIDILVSPFFSFTFYRFILWCHCRNQACENGGKC